MPLTITPTIDTTRKVISLLVAGGTPPYNLTAYPTGLSPYTVRGAWTGTSPNLTKVDAEVRLNVATAYTATDAAAGTASTSGLTVAATSSILSDALDYTQALDVLVVSQPPNRWQARTVTWDVIGRQDPFVTAGPLRMREGELVLRVDSTTRLTLQALLASGNPVLLRSVTPLAVDDVIMAVLDVREDLIVVDNPTGDRHLALTYQAVTRDLGVYVPATSRTYANPLAEATSYTDLLVKFDRYDDVRTGLLRT